MFIKNLPKGYVCTACGELLTPKNWSRDCDEVKSRCRGCQSDFTRMLRYKKIAKGAYSHVGCLNAMVVVKRPTTFISMVRNGKISNEQLAHILREVDFGRDIKEPVWTAKEEEK